MTDTELSRVGDRYDVVRRLGGGSQGETFLAHDPDGGQVVLKRFSIREMRNWKSLELFQREIATLTVLDHAAIPDFVDDLEFDGSHYLVQEYVEGDVLSDVVGAGPLSESELHAVARDVLEVLTYLHELNPPVVHRDVKPSNIIRRPDGRHALVDFGGVQMIVAQDTGGSTVIGTTGYMPSEQLIGRAEARSDLYALGATLAHLATAVHPSELPTKRLRIDWCDRAPQISDHLADLIDTMLDPAPEDRPETARAALAELAGESTTALAERSAGEVDGVATLPPLVAAMERGIRRTPNFIELYIANGETEGVALGVFLGVVAVVIVLTIDVLALKVGLVLVVLLAGRFASRMFTPREQLIVQADGQTEVRTKDSKGKPKVIRGTLTIDEGQLFVEASDGDITRVAKSLTPEQATWFRHEAELFIYSARRKRELAEQATSETNTDAVKTPSPMHLPEPSEPEPDPEMIEALPDRQSHFDLQGDEEPVLARVNTDRPEFERLDRLARPEGIVPRAALRREKKSGGAVVFDLSSKVGARYGWRSTMLAAVGIGVAVLLKSTAIGIIAGTVAFVWFFALLVSARTERLTVYRDQGFMLRTDDDGLVPDQRGRLVPEVRVDGEQLFVLTNDGVKIELARGVPRDNRLWMGFLIQQALSRDVATDGQLAPRAPKP